MFDKNSKESEKRINQKRLLFYQKNYKNSKNKKVRK
jgi:hypothetical protein